MNDLAVPIPKNSLSIQKDMDKCINCGNCLKTCIDEVVSSKILQNNYNIFGIFRIKWNNENIKRCGIY